MEQQGYDLIVMGRPEGQGCYCFANNVLREVLDKLARNYRNIVIDSEAGLEHISRRTLLSVDYLLIVSDCTVRGVRTAGRISALADEVALPAKQRGLIVNRVPGRMSARGDCRSGRSDRAPLAGRAFRWTRT